MLQQEQGWCNFSLLCSVPGAANVSYSWSRDGESLGHENVLQVHEDTEPRTYICNATNPVSSKMASINTTTLCFPPGTGNLLSVPSKLALGVHNLRCSGLWDLRFPSETPEGATLLLG